MRCWQLVVLSILFERVVDIEFSLFRQGILGASGVNFGPPGGHIGVILGRLGVNLELQ